MNDERGSRVRTAETTLLSYVVRLPGLRPRAPKRNVIAVLLYLYVVVVGAWLLLRLV